jgi:hypothetical protein
VVPNKAIVATLLIAWFGVASVAISKEPTAACEHPATLEGFEPAAPRYIVMLKQNVDVVAVVRKLTKHHNLKTTGVGMKGVFIVVNMTDDVLSLLRCEPTVNLISLDSRVSIN